MKWLLFYLPLVCFGAYVGNPGNPVILNPGFFSGRYAFLKGTSGYIYDYTSNKKMRTEEEVGRVNPNEAFKEFGLHSQLASFSVIFLERLEAFGYAGGSKEQAKGRPAASSLLDFKSSYHFSWGAGSKLVLFRWGQTCLGLDFTYFTVPSSSKSFFKFINRLDLPLDFSKQPFSLKEWQMSLGVCSKLLFLTPYGGITYLSSRLRIQGTPKAFSFFYTNEKKIGYFYGLTASLTGRLQVNFEGRVKDETAYTFSTVAVF